MNFYEAVVKFKQLKTKEDNDQRRLFAPELMRRILRTISEMENIAKQNNFKLSRNEIEEIMPEKSFFTVGEAYEIYNKWIKNGLRNTIYKSYKYCSCMKVKKEDKASEPYDYLPAECHQPW